VTALGSPYFKRVSDLPFFRSFGDTEARSIVSYFRKTPPSIICPHFWELRWAFGCPYDCKYCYLQGTFRGRKNARFPYSIDRILLAIESAFQSINEPTIFNSGELADSLMNPGMMNTIADKFEEQTKHKLLLLTKSNNVRLLVEKPRKQTIVSFSLNASTPAKLWEAGAPTPTSRIRAAQSVADAGYETRVRIDPIFPVENWKEEYSELVYDIFSDLTPERVTLGTPRGLKSTILCSKDRTWTRFFGESSDWGKKIPTRQREEIYLFVCDRLQKMGLHSSKIALCKETVSMWDRLRMNPTDIRCNCVW